MGPDVPQTDPDRLGALAGSLVVLGLGLLVLVGRAETTVAGMAGMGLVLLAWVLLLYGSRP
jgi:hypothetical protein